MKKILFPTILVFIIVGGYFTYRALLPNNYIDKEFGFQFSDTTSWQNVTPIDNSYLTFATSLSNGLKSYVYLHLQPQDPARQKYADQFMSKDYTLDLTTLCQKTAKNKNLNFADIEKLAIANTNSYKCYYTTTNTEGDKIIMEQWIIQKIDITILITDLYSATNQEEKEKVTKLLDGFSVQNN